MRLCSFPLRTLLRSLVIAAGPLACSSEPTEMDESVPCIQQNDPARYTQLTPAQGIDGIVFFGLTSPVNGTPAAAASRVATTGTPCAGARDRDACAAAIDAASSQKGWSVADPRSGGMALGASATEYGVVTSGDSVYVIADMEALRTAVAPIESMEEANAFRMLKGAMISCGGKNASRQGNGYVFQYVSGSCGGSGETLTTVNADGTTSSAYEKLSSGDNSCTEGRRPAGLVATGEPWLDSLAAHFGEIAHMEAAAVVAFADLERDLARVGAPESLRARVAKGRLDEIDHTERMSALARRHGAKPSKPEVALASGRLPTVFELALENATEGCVREAFGALVATHQATFATDPSARAAFARIAEDETEHAELSYDLGEWLASLLSPAEIEAVARAQDAAWEALATSSAVEPARDVALAAGMPTAAGAKQLVGGLRARCPRFGTRTDAAS